MNVNKRWVRVVAIIVCVAMVVTTALYITYLI